MALRNCPVIQEEPRTGSLTTRSDGGLLSGAAANTNPGKPRLEPPLAPILAISVPLQKLV
jgi:hypothetical protein